MQNPLETPAAAAPTEKAPALSPLMEGLVKLLRTKQPPAWKGAKIHVPEITSGAYFLYEQIRNAVEYREQHLFLRGAIERFLLRELGSAEPESIGFELVSELTKTRYLANDTITDEHVAYLDYLVDRYATLQKLALAHGKPDYDQVATAIVQLLSVELERALHPHPTEAAIVEFTYASFIKHADVPREDQLVLYAAVHKALLKSDLATIRYGVFSRKFPRWLEDDAQLEAAGAGFSGLNNELAEQIGGSQPHRMFRLVRRHIAPYLILREIIKTSTKGLEQLSTTPSVLMEKARSVAEQQYQVASARLKRSVVQAMIFLFVTKMVIGVLIEIPYELFVYGEVNPVPLAINLIFPPLYMAAVGFGIKTPGPRNTTKILSDLKLIVYQSEQPLSYTLRTRGRRSSVRGAFNLFLRAHFPADAGRHFVPAATGGLQYCQRHHLLRVPVDRKLLRLPYFQLRPRVRGDRRRHRFFHDPERFFTDAFHTHGAMAGRALQPHQHLHSHPGHHYRNTIQDPAAHHRAVERLPARQARRRPALGLHSARYCVINA